MRIHKTSAEGRHELTTSKSGAEKSGRFSKILEERRKDSSPQFNLLSQNQSYETPAATRQPESVYGAQTPVDVQRLASEIVDHISSRQTDSGHLVEIQFNSQTLEALRVSVRSDQGQVAINFLTPVPRIAGLVQQNLDALRGALEDKGIRVSQLVVSRWSG